MRTSLRRSCDGCAKAKHACDLRTPKCSRCLKRQTSCVYANQPLSSVASAAASASTSNSPGSASAYASSPSTTVVTVSPSRHEDEVSLITVSGGQATPRFYDDAIELPKSANTSFDPFDSYPPTRLPRAHAQRLILHFLSKIAFQYYPLDLDMASNPFVVSWWPRALADPALFHVSLQTASLDEELRAMKGFSTSELLMVDSVSLVRRKIESPSLAFQDETLNSVVTLAAIEHGKGNINASITHIDGVKEMVAIRGGIDEVKRSSPLTARMVSWVSMILACTPQFPTQDDFGHGNGIGPIPQWQLAAAMPQSPVLCLEGIDVDPAILDIFVRVRDVLRMDLQGTDLHDLTCFVLHKLLLLPPFATETPSNTPAISECLRNATALFMLLLHGATYYSHHHLTITLLSQLKMQLHQLIGTEYIYSDLGVWILSVGMASSSGPATAGYSQWFSDQAYVAKSALGMRTWDDVLVRLENVLWVKTWRQGGEFFRRGWEEIL